MEKQNLYLELKNKQEQETSSFLKGNVYYAFGDKQLQELLTKLGYKNKEELTKDFTGFFGGGIIRKNKVEEWHKLCEKHYNEIQEQKNNYQFLYDGLQYEMGNHELFYSMDYLKALKYLGFSIEDYNNNETLQRAYSNARHDYHEWCLENNC